MSECPVKTYNPICRVGGRVAAEHGLRANEHVRVQAKRKWGKRGQHRRGKLQRREVGGELNRWRAERTQQLRSPPVLRAS